MASLPEDSAGQIQAHGCGSYPLSFPSEPPDIRNWFSSYQYESPEVPELDTDPVANDGSETQDPLEHQAPGHSFRKHAHQDGGTAFKGGCFGSQSEHDEVSAKREFHSIGRGTVEQGTKRKRSLRELFGAGFLDDHDEDTQTETRVVSPVQRSASDPMCNFNWIGLQNRVRSYGGAAEHSELLVDSESTIIAETQGNPIGGQETDHSKWQVNCGGNFNWIGLRNKKRHHEGAAEHSELLADSECTIIAETQENPLRGHETDHRKLPVNCGGTSLAADTEEGFLEDGLPVNSHSKGLADTVNTDQSLRGFFGAGFLNDRGEANEPTSRLVSAVQRSAVDPLWNCNWVGLHNRKNSHEGAVEHSDLPMDSESTIIAETQENPLGGQENDRSKRLVNCGGTSLADTEDFMKADGIENSNLTGLAGSKKTKQSLRALFGADFLDDGDEANYSETRVVLDVQRNAVEPLSNCNAAGLPHIEQIHEGAAGYSELPADCHGIGLAETKENSPGGQVTKHRLPVNCSGTCLAADTEKGFLEDDIEHTKLPSSSHSTGPADIGKTDTEHRVLHANYSGTGSAVTEESSPGDEINPSKPKVDYQKAEETVAADGFIAIRTKVKPAEECRAKKIPKSSRGRDRVALQENCGILGTQNASVRDRTRSPLSDRTNLSEVLAAPAPEISGKWKCPSKGKPYVAPPMKQLSLEQWVHRTN